MYRSIKKIILLCQLLFAMTAIAEGFLAGTLVKTPVGYFAIESIRVNDVVICLDNNHEEVERPVIFITKRCVPRYIHVNIDDIDLDVGGGQRFYSAHEHKWISISELQVGAAVRTNEVECPVVRHVETINQAATVYLLEVEKFHNFCVSPRAIYVHNFVPLIVAGFTCAFGLGGIELSTISFGLIAGGTFFGYSLYKKNHQSHKKYDGNVIVNSVSLGGDMFPEDPEEKKKQRDDARAEHKPLQNKEARDWAKRLGYKEIKSHPCGNTRNKPVFTNGKRFISPDADGHSGGVWKVFSSRGVLEYAMDRQLEKICRLY